MKNITWVTPDCFADCDIILIPDLLKYFNIHWIILLEQKSRFHEEDFETLRREHKNLNVEFVYQRRLRNPLNIFTFIKLSKIIRQDKCDVAYLNIGPTPWCLAMIPFIKSDKTIVTAHQGRVHEGMSYKKLTTFVRKIWYKHFLNVNMFSKSQALLFKKDFPSSNIYQLTLGLKEFGTPTNQRPKIGDVIFLSFGTLNYAKNIDLLIDAACLLYERGVKNFKVSINGSCKDWSWYQQKIKYPEIFQLDIRMIDNSEIPNLFNGSHYFVQPYRVVSQSGPTKIAYNYNLPVIVSNLPGFLDELEEGVNGYSFEKGNVKSLSDRMQYLIEHHSTDYDSLQERMRAYTTKHYAMNVLVDQYCNMLEEVMNQK